MSSYPIDLSKTPITIPDLPELLIKIFPTWVKGNISIKPVSGGITNMLIKCVHNREDDSDIKDIVLARSYGNNTDLIIDRSNEFQNHLMLNKLNLAPNIYARFSNGIIYGYLSGRSLSPEELTNSDLFPLISQKLGFWHTTITGNEKINNDLWKTISDWINIAPNFDGLSNIILANIENNQVSNIKKILQSELEWLEKHLDHKSKLVKSHCDLLSGNIVIPPSLDNTFKNSKPGELVINHFKESEIQQRNSTYNLILPKSNLNPIAFIDYEYMLGAPRGFDIANHLAEWQGFECDTSRILDPVKDNFKLRRWCYSYLVGSHKDAISLENIEEEIDNLIDEIFFYFGIPAFYWGIWSAIQSKISSIDFDYATYGTKRLKEYFCWKKKIISSLRK